MSRSGIALTNLPNSRKTRKQKIFLTDVIACDTKHEAIEWARQLMFGSEACEVRPVWKT